MSCFLLLLRCEITLKLMYETENNASMVFEINERMFEFKQENQSVHKFYGELKSLIDELEMYQPAVTNTITLKGYH